MPSTGHSDALSIAKTFHLRRDTKIETQREKAVVIEGIASNNYIERSFFACGRTIDTLATRRPC